MNARSALFDLYGDHLRARGGRAAVAALVRMLRPLGIAAPAVRTAVSRMVRQGWLEPVRLDDGPGYGLTPRAISRLDEEAGRIYRTGEQAWDGCWHLLVIDPVPDRSTRERLRSELAYLGYAQLDAGTWISPRASGQLPGLLEAEGLTGQRFVAVHEAVSGADTADLVRRAWDLGALAGAYVSWLETVQRLVDTAGPEPSDEAAFAVRSRLVHEWRKVLFRDPGLPRSLLPADWPGDKAADFFAAEASRLLPPATRFIDGCLETGPTAPPSGAD